MALLVAAAALLSLACDGARRGAGAVIVRSPGLPRPAPVLGVDFIYQDAPHVLIRAFAKRAEGAELGTLLRSRLGIRTIRINSFGFYSFLGPERSAELRRLTEQRNRFPWFPIDRAIDFVLAEDLRVVAGVNPEDGAEAAVEFVERFRRLGALERLVAVEIGNEPHLSKRPWMPEEYAEASAAIIRALEPLGVRCAVALTVGSESKTPTGISDDEYTRRLLARLDALVPLAGREDLYGIVHLYAGGVDPGSIDRLDGLVRPVAPRMRYLVTEYNIRSRLRDNAQLTNAYGLEFVEKTSRLVAHPSVAGLFVHGVPYHSVVYWSGDGGVQTVSGFHDARLAGEAVAPGWHLTPAGRAYGLFAALVWRGELVAYEDDDDVQLWTGRLPEGELRLGVINATSKPVARSVALGDATVEVALGPRSIAVYGPAGEVGRVALDAAD